MQKLIHLPRRPAVLGKHAVSRLASPCFVKHDLRSGLIAPYFCEQRLDAAEKALAVDSWAHRLLLKYYAVEFVLAGEHRAHADGNERADE